MMTQFSHDAFFFAPELVMLLGALAALMAGTFMKDGYRAATWVAYAALGIGLVLLCFTATNNDVSFGLHFRQTAATAFAKIWVIAASIGTLMLSHHALTRVNAQRFEFPVLILLATLGMALLISARDFLALYVGLELQSLSLYILAAFIRQSERGAEAGLKYFVLGALSSGLLLYGVSLLYGATGTIQFDGLEKFIASGAPGMAVTLSLVFIIAALAFKISAAPFHMWTPDVYQGAATPITVFFTTAPKVAGAMVLMQLLHGPLAGASAAWSQIIWAVAALSLIIGSFAALMQTDIKRLLAYSTINHVGFLLIAMISGGQNGFAALLVYLAVYVILSLGTFGIILLLQQQGEIAESLSDLRGIARRRPRLSICLAILMFAAAGVPPTAGFLGKMFVLLAAMQSDYVWLAALGVITSLVATFYYLHVIKLMYFDDAPAGLILPTIRMSRRLVALVAVTTVLTAGMMIAPSVIVDPAMATAKTMINGVAH